MEMLSSPNLNLDKSSQVSIVPNTPVQLKGNKTIGLLDLEEVQMPALPGKTDRPAKHRRLLKPGGLVSQNDFPGAGDLNKSFPPRGRGNGDSDGFDLLSGLNQEAGQRPSLRPKSPQLRTVVIVILEKTLT
jgi:hypothetical protein